MGSMPPGHLAIAAALVRGGLSLPAAAILGILPAASFVTRPPGTAWQGAWRRGRVSPFPSGSSAGAQAAGGGELSGSGMAGHQGAGNPAPGSPRLGEGLLISEPWGVPAAGTRARAPARARARRRAPCALPIHRGYAATRDSPLPRSRRPRRLQDQSGAASVATGSASPATAAPRAAAAQSAPSERVPEWSPEPAPEPPEPAPRSPPPSPPPSPPHCAPGLSRAAAASGARASAPGQAPPSPG